MQTRPILRQISVVEHFTHHTMLIIVGVSLVGELFVTYFPEAAGIGSILGQLLHWLHWAALVVVGMYGIVYLFLSKKPGRDYAEILKPSNLPTIGEKTTVPVQSQPRPVDENDVVFVTATTESLIPISFEMNRIAYEGSAFELTKAQIKKRNTAYLAINNRLFMLLRDPMRETTVSIATNTIDDFIGYTCVLPLSEIGINIYTMGLIPDRELPALLICKEGEQASALLLFAIYLDEDHRKSHVGSKYSPFLKRCIEHHINAVAYAHAHGADKIPVWVQTEDSEMEERYVNLGYEKTVYKSAEKYHLYRRLHSLTASHKNTTITNT